MPSADFLHALFPNERTMALKACLIVFFLSESTMVPKQLQLQAALAELAGFDSTLMSGTGSGKTLAIAIPHMCMGASDVIDLVVRFRSSSIAFVSLRSMDQCILVTRERIMWGCRPNRLHHSPSLKFPPGACKIH